MKKQLLQSLLILICFSSCISPLPISRLSTDDSEGKWVAGRKYVTQNIDDYSLTLSFYKSDGNLLLFDALFENTGNKDIDFSPIYAQIAALDENKEIISVEVAIDPESKLLEFDKTESRERANLANQSISNTVMATSDLIATVSDETNPNVSREQAYINYNKREWERQNRLADMGRQEAYLESIQNTRLYWEEAPIRRTTVGGNEYVDGRLFFNRTKNASFFKIKFVIPDAGVFEFNYKHELIKPFN